MLRLLLRSPFSRIARKAAFCSLRDFVQMRVPRFDLRHLFAVATLCVVATAGSSSARGGCTYEGSHRSWHAEGSAYFDQLTSLGAMGSDFDPGSLPFQSPKGPCNGPSCSGAPGMPAPPPPLMASFHPTWACLSVPATALPTALTRVPRDDARYHASVEHAPVFHPPRPGLS